MEEQFNKEAEEGCRLQLTRRVSQMRMQAARIASTPREESLLQLIATWEQSLVQKKERLCQS